MKCGETKLKSEVERNESREILFIGPSNTLYADIDHNPRVLNLPLEAFLRIVRGPDHMQVMGVGYLPKI